MKAAGSNVQGTASWGFVTPYGAAVAQDSPYRSARGALYNGISGEAPLSDISKPHPYKYPPYVELLDPIPVDLGDVVAVGTVMGGKSYLSNDRTTIYSELQFRVTSILSAAPNVPILPNTEVPIVRVGGVLKMPSGGILTRGCPSASIPRFGHQYLTILKYSRIAAAFPLVAGYELDGNSVLLLDQVIKGSSGNFTLGQYGKGPAAFLADVAAAISNSRK